MEAGWIVQDPPYEGPFNSLMLNWSNGTAYIKSSRLHDFVSGEGSCHSDAKTEFVTRCSYKGGGTRHNWESYAMYYCKYGTPERVKKSMLSSNFIQDPSTKAKFGPGSRDRLDHDSHHKGCQCRFSAIKLLSNDHIPPGITKLIYKHRRHVNAAGVACHGTACSDSVGLPSQMARNLSSECREWVECELRRGLTPPQILMRAAKALFENHQRLGYVQGSPIRDLYITSADVYNIKLELDKETWRRHANDRISTELWMKANSSQVVLYQAPKSDPFKPLRLAVTRPLLLDWLLKHGNGGCVAIDGTHGTQKYKYPLYTLMVFDEYEHGHPTVFGFLEKEETEDLVDLLSAVKKMAQHYIPGWMLSCFMTDCADNERLALDIVFPHIPVFLCIYHVRKAWTKKLIEVVSGHEKRAIMNAALEDLCFGSTLIADGEEFDVERSAAMKLLLLYKKFQLSEPQFVKYFQTEWEPCMGQWIRDERRKTCRNNQDTNNAMESMHGHMKDFLYGWRRNAHEQRLDHTVYGLLGDFVMRIWYKDQKKLLGFIPNKKKDQRVIAVIMKTRSMLTVPVTWPHGYAGPALVGSTSKLNRRYLVNWRREKYACECFWSLQGNFCKHQIFILRRKGYSETNICICLGIRFGGIRGGIKELFDKGPSSQIYDFNEDPVLRRELADIEVKDDCHDTFNLTEDTDSPVKKASKPTDLEEEEKIKRVLHTQLVWLKDFFDENPSMLKVGELELRHCIGRIKESHQAWSTGRILPVADMWRTSMLDKHSSSFRKLSWLEKVRTPGERTRRANIWR